MDANKIIIRGARQHNLKNINLDLPRNKLIVVTGLSGSGKSTLVFDTLYAEGQRRYVESLSVYARQFLERMEKPDVDLIEGLSPAVAIEQKAAGHNPRSTVGTVTEIHDYLRLLFARVGTPHCHQCGTPIVEQSLDQIMEKAMGLPKNTRILILAPMVREQKGDHAQLFKKLRKDGFARVRLNGEVLEIEEIGALNKKRAHTIEVVVDRLVIHPGVRNRLADSLELAIAQSGGQVVVDVIDGQSIVFNEQAACERCGIRYPDFSPASFSFNSPQGACPHCDGLGSSAEFDPELIVPNPELSLRDEAVAVWEGRSSVQFAEFLDALTTFYGVDIYTAYKSLPESFKQILMHGSGEVEIPFYMERGGRRISYRRPFEGILPNLRRRYLETESHQAREEIKRFIKFVPCPECGGAKLNPASRSVRVGGATLPEISRLAIGPARNFFSALELEGKKAVIARRILKEIQERIGFLEDVGLGYLTLDRSASTLSGGESQRIRLATQIGSKLTGVLYVLDEPSIGLHPRDNRRLIESLMRMRDLGNTVVVVEHDEETILASDFVVDMGPGAGANGGEVVFAGSPEELLRAEHSLTGRYLSGRRTIETPARRRSFSNKKLVIRGARHNNLKGIDVEFPLGRLVCVTGVSGSGKSSLVFETLYRALAQRLNHARISAGSLEAVEGLQHIDRVIHIDQSPIGKTPRSNPGTYTGVFTVMRELFARTPEARVRGYKAGRFSFNVKGGRCETCQGDGIIKIEMHFLPDVYVPCDVCRGRRFNRETLEIRYKGRNIDEVMHMTVNHCLRFFASISQIQDKLQTLADVGLGYVQIGQSATTLSGGEAQRVKLSRELGKRGTGRTVYLLDEPTTGLHMDDIQKLLAVLSRLVDEGNTVIVIEHNLDVIKCADHIIDLGPEGGDAGGEIMAAGTPEEVSQAEGSHTGRFLQSLLARNSGRG